MTFLRSFLYALLGGVTTLSIGVIVFIVLQPLAGTYVIVSSEFMAQNAILYPISEILIKYSIFFVVAEYFFLALGFVFFFRLINQNFSKDYRKEHGIHTCRLVLLLLASLFFILIFASLPSLINSSLVIFIPSLFILLVWVFWNRYGLWGSLLQCAKARDKRLPLFRGPKKEDKRHIIAFSVRGVLFACCVAVFYLFAFTAVTSLLFVAKQFGVGHPWLPLNKFFLFFFFSFFLFGAFYLPLTYAFSDIQLARGQRLIRSIIPILLLAGSITLTIAVIGIIQRHDYVKSFYTATGIDISSPLNQRIIVFGSDGTKVYNRDKVVSKFFSLSAKDLNMKDILGNDAYWLPGEEMRETNILSAPCTRENIQKTTDWLGKGKESALLLPAFGFLRDCYKATWDMDQLLRLRYWSFQKTNNVIDAMALIGRMKALAQESSLHIRYLQLLKSDPLTYISEKGKQRIQETLEHYASVNAIRGYISGQLFIHEKPAIGSTVGLLRDKLSKDALSVGEYNYGEYIDKPIEKYLVASAKTDAYGRFFFPNLRADTYYLGTILPQDLSTPVEEIIVATEKSLKGITVSQTNRTYALGSIAITKNNPSGQWRIELENGPDAENDGLSDEEEKYYGTNPQEKDTDGDGFSDYDELASGYNPLLKGGVRYYPKNVIKAFNP